MKYGSLNEFTNTDENPNSFKIGNIKSERLIDIWNKPHYQKIRSDIREGNFTLDICKDCSDACVTTSDIYD